MTWSIHVARRDYDRLHRHLFPGDADEHAAFFVCGIARSGSTARLLVRDVVLVDDSDFGLSNRGGYRQVAARRVARAARLAGDERLCLVWIHSHPGSGHSVRFSRQDRRTHAAAVPALSAITAGMPVGAVVLGEHSAAGIITTVIEGAASDEAVDYLRVIGGAITDLTEDMVVSSLLSELRFARQIHLFGTVGQERLRRLTVAVVGAGGGGSLIVQMLAHLGVGTIIVIDFDVVEKSNLSRIAGSTPSDAEQRVKKVTVAERLVAAIDPGIKCTVIDGDITYADDARSILTADFIFLATDTVLARWAFNLICHQYLIPGIQVGAKVTPHGDAIATMHVMNRVLAFQGGCLDCMGVIPAEALAGEQLTATERKAQRYLETGDEDEIEDAAVISLNGIATSLAATDFLFVVTGLHADDHLLDQLTYHPLERSLRHRSIDRKPGCSICDPGSLSSYGRGDTWPLQLRSGRSVASAPSAELAGWRRSSHNVAKWLRRLRGPPKD